MNDASILRCRHAFETVGVHADGEVVCTIIDGRFGITLWFDFAHTWGRSRRRPDAMRYLTPYLRPFTALPGEPRQDGW